MSTRNQLIFVFAASSLKRFIYLIMVASAAFVIQAAFDNTQRSWLIWSALLFSFITSGDTFKSRVTIIILTGLAAGLAAFLAGSLASYFLLLALYLFVLTTACLLFSQAHPTYFLLAFIINLLAIVSAGLPVSMPMMLDRFTFILIGAAITMIFQALFYFHFAQNEWRWYIMMTLRQLRKLNDEIFSCFLQPEYADNIYLYERRLHLQKQKCLRSISRLRELTKEKGNQQPLVQKKFDQIYDLLLDCSQLRRRVTDHTTFGVCRIDLTTIHQELERLFEGLMAVAMGKKFFPDVTMLQEKIGQLEETYGHVLQISSREPLVFLLFIYSLKALSSEMLNCYEVILGN